MRYFYSIIIIIINISSSIVRPTSFF